MTNPSPRPEPRYNVLIASFAGTGSAAAVVERLRSGRAFDEFEIQGEAIVWRDRDGTVHLHERGGAGIGAAFGATAAGIVGLLGGPVILPLLMIVGGLLGGLAGHMVGRVVPPEDLQRAGDALPPDSSAFIAIIGSAHANAAADIFTENGASVLNVPVETELSNVIREAIDHDITRA